MSIPCFPCLPKSVLCALTGCPTDNVSQDKLSKAFKKANLEIPRASETEAIATGLCLSATCGVCIGYRSPVPLNVRSFRCITASLGSCPACTSLVFPNQGIPGSEPPLTSGFWRDVEVVQKTLAYYNGELPR